MPTLFEDDSLLIDMNAPATSSSPTRILFVAGIEEAPLRYRVYLPAEALRRRGIASEVRFHTDPQLDELAADADLVVLFRVRATKRILKLIDSRHRQRKPVLFDIDDLVFAEHSSIPWLNTLPPVEANIIRRNNELFRIAMQSCDGVIVSTAQLGEEVKKLGLPWAECPNGVGERLLELSHYAVEQIPPAHPFRIGYLSGTFTHQADWLLIEPAILDFMDQHSEVELWLVGQVRRTESLARFGDRVKFMPLVPWQHLPALTRQLDVNLAPLSDGTFNECKSAIKWLEAALVQVPTIASAIPPYAGVITHGQNGMLATTLTEWRECLERLIASTDIRVRLGQQAQNDAIERFGLEIQSERYEQILAWAKTLPTGKVALTSVPEEPARPHALEPFDLTLVYSRPYPQVPTAPLSVDEPLEFQLVATDSVRMRLDLLFATYGGPGSPVNLVVSDAEHGEVLAKTTADAKEIGEESWTAFELELSRPCTSLSVKVTLAEPGRVALWADLSGLPCVKLWIAENAETPSTLPVITTNPPSFLQIVLARSRSAFYIWRVKGARATWKRAQQALSASLRWK